MSKMDIVLIWIGTILGWFFFVYGIHKLNVLITIIGGSMGWLAFIHYKNQRKESGK